MRTALAAASIAAALLMMELGVRWLYPAPPLLPQVPPGAPQPAVRFERSAFSRHVLPNREHRVLHKGRLYRINDKGYRGAAFPWQPPPGELRAIVYGGSAVFDILADEGLHWPARVEALLARRGHPEFRVINAGVPGHASFDCLGRLLAEGHLLQPDYVLLYNAWNDIKTFTMEESLLRGVAPYRPRSDFVRRPTGPLDRALARSHLYRHLRLPLHAALRGRALGREGAQPAAEIAAGFRPQQVAQFRLTVATFVDLARNAGATPLLVTQARLPTAQSGAAERARIAYGYAGLEHDALVRAFAATDRALLEVGEQKGVTVVDTASLSGRPALFNDAVHLTAEGSAALAERVADALLAEHQRSTGIGKARSGS